MADDRDARIAQFEAALASARQREAALVAELAESREQQVATAEVLRVIASSPTDLETVLQAILDAAASLCDAEHGILFQGRERDGMLSVRVGHGLFVELREQWRAAGEDVFDSALALSISEKSATGRAFLERRAIAVDDIADQGELPEGRENLEGLDLVVHSSLAVPLLRRGEPIGVLTMSRSEVRPFTER